MERFVGQANHFFPWGPPLYDDLAPLPEERWASPEQSTTASSVDASSASHAGSRSALCWRSRAHAVLLRRT